jgi:hypothetical protein
MCACFTAHAPSIQHGLPRAGVPCVADVFHEVGKIVFLKQSHKNTVHNLSWPRCGRRISRQSMPEPALFRPPSHSSRLGEVLRTP